jgi:FeS assembly SUF system protein
LLAAACLLPGAGQQTAGSSEPTIENLQPTMSAIIITQNTELTQRVIDVIKTCYDPEIPVDIWELGLIYEIELDAGNNLKVKMTLTSPSCPVAETLPPEVEQKLRDIEGIASAKVELTFDPPWDKNMMSEVAQVELGFM